MFIVYNNQTVPEWCNHHLRHKINFEINFVINLYRVGQRFTINSNTYWLNDVGSRNHYTITLKPADSVYNDESLSNYLLEINSYLLNKMLI